MAGMTDPVHHPEHYSAARFGIECIEISRYMTFPAGNALKYVWRHADKADPVQDLEKALVYLQWAAEDFLDYGVPPLLDGAKVRVWGLERLYLTATEGPYTALNHILHARYAAAEDSIARRLTELTRGDCTLLGGE